VTRPRRKRRYGVHTVNFSLRFSREAYDRLTSTVPRGSWSEFVERAAMRELDRVRRARAVQEGG
jgi:hypothetical protein